MKLKQVTKLALSNMADCIQMKEGFRPFLATIYSQLSLLTTFGQKTNVNVAGTEKPEIYKNKEAEVILTLGKKFKRICRMRELASDAMIDMMPVN